MGVQKIVKCRGLHDMYVGSGKVCSLAWDSNPFVFLLSFGFQWEPLELRCIIFHSISILQAAEWMNGFQDEQTSSC
jgi:hypothetical protein